MMIETGILWIILFIVCVFFLQRDLCRRFKTKFTDDISSGEESSVPSETNETVFNQENHHSSIETNVIVKKSVTVDTNEQNIEETVAVHKSDSDEGDFEVISKEQLNDMADQHNGENEGGERRFSVSEEANDKFPEQMTTKNSNWNTMELGEKRKRLR